MTGKHRKGEGSTSNRESFPPPSQGFLGRQKGFVVRHEDGFAGEGAEFGFAEGAAGFQETGDAPVSVWRRGDDAVVHGPVMNLAQGHAVAGVIIAAQLAIPKGDEVSGIDKGEVVHFPEADAEPAGGALEVVDLQDGAAEAGGPSRLGLGIVVLTFRERRREVLNAGFLKQEGKRAPGLGEIAGDDGPAQAEAFGGRKKPGGDGRRDAGKDLSAGTIPNERWCLQRLRTLWTCFEDQPPAFIPEVEERILRGVLIIALSDKLEVAGEPLPEVLAPGNVARPSAMRSRTASRSSGL